MMHATLILSCPWLGGADASVGRDLVSLVCVCPVHGRFIFAGRIVVHKHGAAALVVK